QFRGRRRPAYGAGVLDRGNVPSWPVDEKFAMEVFTFARLKYNSTGWERSSYAWWTDYPDADLNLSYRLQQLTALKVNPEPKVVEITDAGLFSYLWGFMIGAGNIICHHTDNGDGWEEERSDPWFFSEFSEKKNYPLGFNIIFYAMTH